MTSLASTTRVFRPMALAQPVRAPARRAFQEEKAPGEVQRSLLRTDVKFRPIKEAEVNDVFKRRLNSLFLGESCNDDTLFQRFVQLRGK